MAAKGNAQAQRDLEAIVTPADYSAWQAFWTLHAGRGVGLNGPEPIRVSEVRAYGDMARMSAEQQMRLLRSVRVMDRTILEWVREHGNSDA